MTSISKEKMAAAQVLVLMGIMAAQTTTAMPSKAAVASTRTPTSQYTRVAKIIPTTHKNFTYTERGIIASYYNSFTIYVPRSVYPFLR